MITPSFNKVVIDLKALKHNFALLRKIAGKSTFLAMVKADAYGHGMIECSHLIEKDGCGAFGVAELGEAILLRQSGIKGAIYSMVGFDIENVDSVCHHDITPVVFNFQDLKVLSQTAIKHKKEIGLHLKIDCGMSRLGIKVDETEKYVQRIKELPGIRLAGVASHFPCSDNIESSATQDCFKIFRIAQQNVDNNQIPINHIANSGAILYFPETHCDMVRCGIALYGYYPDGSRERNDDGLRPVMSFSTRVVQVKDVPPGTGVSYGHTYITKKHERLAVLPVGYEDGFSRQLTNCGEVLIRGKRAPVRGRVCMNLCMVDITDIEGVEPGDEVILIGKQGDESITADDIASKIGTISYEVLCMIGNNNERVFI